MLSCKLCSPHMVYACSHEFGNDLPPCASKVHGTGDNCAHIHDAILLFEEYRDAFPKSFKVYKVMGNFIEWLQAKQRHESESTVEEKAITPLCKKCGNLATCYDGYCASCHEACYP